MCNRYLVGAMILVASVGGSTAQGVVILEESFDYTVGESALVQGAAGGNWAGGYFTPDINAIQGVDRTEHEAQTEIATGSLVYTDSGGRQLLSSGNHYRAADDGRIFNPALDREQGGKLAIYRHIDGAALAASSEPAVQALMFDNDPGPGASWHVGKEGSSLWLSFMFNGAGMGFMESYGSTDIIGNIRPPVALEKPVPQSGDFNGNGVVDGNDFLAWQRGESPNPLAPSDLADWQTNYGTAGGGSELIPVSFADGPTENDGLKAAVRKYQSRMYSATDGSGAVAFQANRAGASKVIPGLEDFSEVQSRSTPANSTANFFLMRIDFVGDPSGEGDANGNWLEYPWFDPETGVVDRNGTNAADHPMADRVYMWINPDLDSVPSDQDAIDNENAAALMPYLGEYGIPDDDRYYVDRWDLKFDLITFGGGILGDLLDEFRAGTTFADVTPFVAQASASTVPEPSSCVLLILGGIGVGSAVRRSSFERGSHLQQR